MQKAPHPSLLDETADMPMGTTHEAHSLLASITFAPVQSVMPLRTKSFGTKVVFPFPFRTEHV
jgi:hypothetical protein